MAALLHPCAVLGRVHWPDIRIDELLGEGIAAGCSLAGCKARKIIEDEPRQPGRCHRQGCNYGVAPLWSHASNRSFSLTPQQCDAATTNWGAPPGPAWGGRVAGGGAGAGAGGLIVVVLGGSVSCAQNQGKRRDPDVTAPPKSYPVDPTNEAAWPNQLQRLLRSCPIARGAATAQVLNFCANGEGSDSWLAGVGAALTNGHQVRWEALRRADIVLVETGMNDVKELMDTTYRYNFAGMNDVKGLMDRESPRGEPRQRQSVEVYTEALARVLLALPKGPLLLWVEASTRPSRSSVNRRTLVRVDAAASHWNVLRRYGIGQVSALDAIGAMPGGGAPFFFSHFVQDEAHPSRLGHRMVASLVASHLAALLSTNPGSNNIYGGGASRSVTQVPSGGGAGPSVLQPVPSPFAVASAAPLYGDRVGALEAGVRRPVKGWLDLTSSELCEGQTPRPGRCEGSRELCEGSREGSAANHVFAKLPDLREGGANNLYAKLPDLAATHGFRARYDVPGKCGLIGDAAGQSVRFTLRNATSVAVAAMFSYAHNGAAILRLYCAGDRVHLLEMDTLTQTGSNVSVYGERWLDAPAGSGPCNLLSVEIVSSVPPRAENKVKLLRVVAY